MVQLSTTYFILLAAIVAAVVVASAAAATDPDPEADSDSETDSTSPPATDNPRCKHPLFCRQRPQLFGQRLRPSIPTTTPSATSTTTKRSASRFSARPNLYNAENFPQVNNNLQANTRSRFPSRTTPAPTEENVDPQTADIEDFKANEERTTPLKRNRLRITTSAPTPERSSIRSKTTSARPDISEDITTTPGSVTKRRRLPVTMARYRTNAAKPPPKTTLAPELDHEDDDKTTVVPTTVSPIADCPDGVCTTIKRIPGGTVVVRKKKIRPSQASRTTTDVTPVTEIASANASPEDTTLRQSPTPGRTATRRPFVSNRVPGTFKGRTTQRVREQTSTTTQKAITNVFQEVVPNPVTQTANVRRKNINKLKNRKKITTTPEPFDNTEYPTTHSWREVLDNSEEVSTKTASRSNKKCGKSCRGQTTTPEPENYPTAIFPLRPLKQRNEQKSAGQEKDSFVFNNPQVEYKTETENTSIVLSSSFSNLPPVTTDYESPITTQYLKEVTPTTERIIIAISKNANTPTKDFVKSKNSLPVQTKTRNGKNHEGQITKANENLHQAQSAYEFSNPHRPQTAPVTFPGNQPSTLRPNDFSGYKYIKPEVSFNPPTTMKPFQQTTKTPVYETPKNMGGYLYTKPAAAWAQPTTARPRPQTTQTLGLNGYMYSKPQTTYTYPTTMKPAMQESTSFLPMLLQKKQEVLENTPIIGPAMTTVRNIINFITKPDEMFAKKYQHSLYTTSYQYPMTYNPMIPQTTYPPYMNFPPYPPRNTFQKQTTSVDSGFKLKGKPRKKDIDENCTMKTPRGFEALTMRTVSSPRPFKKQTNEPYPFESTSSQYNSASSQALKAQASSHHHHYRSPSRSKHAGRGNSSGRKTRTRSSRRRCHNMRCRSSRPKTFRSEDESIYVPVSSIMKVTGPKLRTKRQDSEGEGYVYPRPTSAPTDDLSATTGILDSPTRPTLTGSGTTTSSTSGSSSNTEEPFEGYEYSKPSDGSTLSTIAPSGSTGSSSNHDEPFEGYEYSRPSDGSTSSSSVGLTSTKTDGLTSTSGSPAPTTPNASSSIPVGSKSPDEPFEGYEYSRPSGGASLTSNPNLAASGGSNKPEESFEGYEYSKPAKPFLPEPGTSPLPQSEQEGYDYPKPSKSLSS